MKFRCLVVFVLSLVFPFSANADSLVGMPPVLDPNNIYSANKDNNLSDVVKNMPERVYVPNLQSSTVSVIDPKTYKIVKTIKTRSGPQHVVPSWDLKTLWVNDNKGNYLTPIDPMTVTAGKNIYVHDPYNLYFTPNGKYAIVMAESDKQIVFRDPHTMAIKKAVKVPCEGVNHADWSADGSFFVATCEFSGTILKLDTAKMRVIGKAILPFENSMRPMPQDIKISPDGKVFYIADMASNGVWIMPADNFGKFTFLKTGRGTHGLYVTRDSKRLLITNREEGSVSVLRFSDNKLIAKWLIPGGGSPDMGNISADGKFFWVSGRYDNEVYVFDIEQAKFVIRIKVGKEPHGLTFWPQPGRYSLGHTGIMR
ncbi:MAG: YncE family protein [Actinomycetales bacterium]|jgi:YVTN family beta-propeller protein|nr:MAG: YncE family protein [Actinomycetales bacterium]